jgi:hypothetical protein
MSKIHAVTLIALAAALPLAAAAQERKNCRRSPKRR